MATPPTFGSSGQTSVWNTNTKPKTISCTLVDQDVLVVAAVLGDWTTSSDTFATPTGGGLAYTLEESINLTTYTSLSLWTAPSTSNQTFNISITPGASTQFFGGAFAVFHDSTGIGVSAQAHPVPTGAANLNLTTTGDNSAVVMVIGDWTPVDGASRTYVGVNGYTPTSGNGLELAYAFTSGQYTAYFAYWPDAGAAGTNNFGLSAPTGQKIAIAAVEIFGSPDTGPGGTSNKAKQTSWNSNI